MREIALEEIKQIQLDILHNIDIFCTTNNLRYSLAYGSLIGVIRHKGYIPWDDDIDIMMPREDYNKFISSFNGYFPHLSVISPEINLEYYAPYANVYDNRTVLEEKTNSHLNISIGIKIDIFPLDFVPENNFKYQLSIKLSKFYNLCMYTKRTELMLNNGFGISTLKAILIKLFSCFFTHSFFQKQILHAASSSKASKYIDNLVFPVYANTRIPQNSFDSLIRVSFEDKDVYIIRDYNLFLRKVYGDYMVLPPEEKRIPHHNFQAYWKNN